MIPFRTGRAARFTARVAFTTHAYGNIDFLAADGTIPFHISLRRDEGVVVINRRDAAGWRRELVHPWPFAPQGCRVALDFADGCVTVTLDGRALGRFDRFPRPARGGRLGLRRGFPGLDRIEQVNPRDGIDPTSLVLETSLPVAPAPRADEGGLVLTDRLEIEAPHHGPHPLTATLPGGDTLPLIARPPGHAPFGAPVPGVLLPGRLWRDAPDGMARLQVHDAQGRAQGTLVLDRARAAAAIDRLARAGALAQDRLSALQAIEHARFAALLPDLPAPARRALTAAAAAQGLEAWLLGDMNSDADGVPDGTATAPPDGAAAAPRPDPALDLRADRLLPPALRHATRITAALRAAQEAPAAPATGSGSGTGAGIGAGTGSGIGADIAAPPDPVALLRALQDKDPLPAPERRALLLALSEPVALQGDPRALAAYAAAEGLIAAEPATTAAAPWPTPTGDPWPTPTGDPWTDSAMLPFLHAQARHDTLREALWSLARPHTGWLVSPCVAWVARAALDGVPDLHGRIPDATTREEILYAVIGVIEAEAASYWGRSPCVALTDAALAMLEHADRLSEHLRTDLVWTLLRVYGLSPRFWDGVAAAQARGAALPEPITALAPAFARLRAIIEDNARGRAIIEQDARGRAIIEDNARGRAITDDTAAEIDRLLHRFQLAGAREVARWRHELLGPAGVAGADTPTASGPDPAALREAGLDAGETALRWLAAPTAAPTAAPAAAPAAAPTDDSTPDPRPDPPAALVRAAAEALPALWDGVPRLPMAGALRAATAQAQALLGDPGPPNPDRLAEVCDRLAALGDARSHHIGAGLMLGLATALAERAETTALAERAETTALAERAGTTALAERAETTAPAERAGTIAPAERAAAAPADAVLDRLAAVVAGLDARARAALAAAPAVAGALHTLARRRPAEDALVTRAHAILGGTPAPAPTEPPDPANPLFDLVVVVLSCKPYLDTRIPALRAGWMADLARAGVPCLVMVGGGDGQRRGDVVHLDAPDDYEGLPQKTLAAVEWVRAHTGAARMLKIDDDCYLNVAEFLGLPAFLGSDYHGRVLTRVPGQMDRTWHMAKSRSPRGRFELDKSPEPARYADGGSGYVLSRRAMTALSAAAASAAGRVLIAGSFMEDKLVGDLLALAGITPAGAEHRAAVLRRPRPGAALVSQWENGVLPFRGAPVTLAHLDGHEHQAQVHAQRDRPWPRPAKLWPSFAPVRLGAQSNALELVSPPERLARARRAPVAVVAVMRNEALMVPHFLKHYRDIGVDCFLIADNGSDDGTLDALLDAPDVAAFSVDTDYARSQYGVAWQQALLAAYRVGRWSLLADADELLVWDLDTPGAQLPDLLAGPEFAAADAARVMMLDMYPGGPLSAATFDTSGPFGEAGFCEREPFLRVSGGRGPWSDAPVLTSALRHRLIPGSRPELFVAQKYALLNYRPWMRLSAGLHFVANTRPAPRDLVFAHFKYTAAFRARARAEVARRQHFNDAEEYRKYLALLSEGREVIHHRDHSVRWTDCPTLRHLCRPGGGRVEDLPHPAARASLGAELETDLDGGLDGGFDRSTG